LGGEVPRKFNDKEGRTWQLFLIGFMKSDDPTSEETDLERFIRDVEKKILTDRGLGSNVIDAEITSVRSDLGLVGYPQFGIFVMELTVHYDKTYANP
jgi:hypothetical protein